MDRFNSKNLQQITKLASSALKLYKKVRNSDKILSKYMFDVDIQEFINSKVLGKLREC